jgi:hypothetical protein
VRTYVRIPCARHRQRHRETPHAATRRPPMMVGAERRCAAIRRRTA